MAQNDVFLPSAKKREVGYRQVLRSSDLNAFQDEVIRDLSRVSKVHNSLLARFEKRTLQLEQELRVLQAQSAFHARRLERQGARAAVTGADLHYDQDMRALTGLGYDNVAEARRLRAEPLYGHLTLPMNRAVSRLYSSDPLTGEVFVPSGLGVAVASVDEGDGVVEADDPQLAADGRLGEGFLRRVLLPVESDRTEVVMDVTVDVPSTFASEANVLTLLPSPAGQVDVVNVWYSTTDADPTTVLEPYGSDGSLAAFVEEPESFGTQLHFAPLGITKLRVRLRQRHFVIEEQHKVFTYGLREVLLDLVEWDKTGGSAGFDASHNLAVFRVDAPAGYDFDKLKGFVSQPAYAVPAADTGIYFGVFEDAALTTGVWDSYTDPAIDPLSAGTYVDVSGSNVSTLYVAVKLRYDQTQSVSPLLRNLYLTYTVA